MIKARDSILFFIKESMYFQISQQFLTSHFFSSIVKSSPAMSIKQGDLLVKWKVDNKINTAEA